MAESSTARGWGGDVIYSHFLSPNTKPDYSEAKMSLSQAEEMMNKGDKTFKITQIQVHACCEETTTCRLRANTSKPQFYIVLVKTEDDIWWVLNIDNTLVEPGHLFIGKLNNYQPGSITSSSVNPGVLAGTVSWLTEHDEANLSVEQLFRWFDPKYILELQIENPGDSLIFCTELFNKVAKTKTWERSGGFLQFASSSSKPSKSGKDRAKGGDWVSMVRYMHDGKIEAYADEWLGQLRDELDPHKDLMITCVKVFKLPLYEWWQLTNKIMFHSYVVFETCSSKAESVWWSLEKNSKCIALQRGESMEKVRDLLGQKKRYKSLLYWRPQLVGEDICVDQSLAQIIDLIHENDELNIKYHGTTENCQTFAKVIFDKLAISKKLDYGSLPDISTEIHRAWTGYFNPRPKNNE